MLPTDSEFSAAWHRLGKRVFRFGIAVYFLGWLCGFATCWLVIMHAG